MPAPKTCATFSTFPRTAHKPQTRTGPRSPHLDFDHTAIPHHRKTARYVSSSTPGTIQLYLLEMITR